jgi:hypothetical protein
MRLMSSVALGFAASLLAAPLSAQASFMVAGGLTVPVGNTADAVKSGFNVTAGLGIKPPLAPIGLRFEGMWNSMDFKSGVASGATRILGGAANVTLSGPALPMGYLIGGLGMYNVATPDITGSDAVTKFGFNVGAGLNFPLTGISTYAEVRYHRVSTEGEALSFVPITFGIRF